MEKDHIDGCFGREPGRHQQGLGIPRVEGGSKEADHVD